MDPRVGTGLVGAPACGDVMKLQIQVNDNGTIEKAFFKTFGCGSAIVLFFVFTFLKKLKIILYLIFLFFFGLHLILPRLIFYYFYIIAKNFQGFKLLCYFMAARKDNRRGSNSEKYRHCCPSKAPSCQTALQYVS